MKAAICASPLHLRRKASSEIAAKYNYAISKLPPQYLMILSGSAGAIWMCCCFDLIAAMTHIQCSRPCKAAVGSILSRAIWGCASGWVRVRWQLCLKSLRRADHGLSCQAPSCEFTLANSPVPCPMHLIPVLYTSVIW